MTTNTARYRFEFRIFKWAEALSLAMCGERRAMFLGLRSDGSVRRAYWTPDGNTWNPEQKRSLVEAHPVWLLYAPHQDLGTGYIEWQGVTQGVVERWLDRRFEPADFHDVRTTSVRDRWPESWQVIFGG